MMNATEINNKAMDAVAKVLGWAEYYNRTMTEAECDACCAECELCNVCNDNEYYFACGVWEERMGTDL